MESVKWYVTFALALTDETVGTFLCSIDVLSRYVSKTGRMEGSVPIVSPEIGKRLASIVGGEGRMTMYIYHGNELWWGGFLDSTHLVSSSAGAMLNFSGTTFESYPDRREARTDKDFKGTDQTEIARWCWNYMQGTGPGSNILVDTAFPAVRSVARDLSWIRSDVRTVGSILQEISNRVDGFEWIIDTYDDGGIRRRKLTIGYPTIGRPNYELILTYPGNIITWEIEGDSLDGATSFQARGKAPDPVGSPNPMPNPGGGIVGNPSTPKGSEKKPPIMSKEFHADDLHKQGHVRIDATVQQDKVTDVKLLDKWAELARELRAGPLVLPSVTVRLEGMTQAVLGSEVQLRIRDHPFPDGEYGEPGYMHTARVIGYEVNPGEFGSPTVAKLIFENPYDEDAQRRFPK